MVDENDPVLIAAEQVYWARLNGMEPCDVMRSIGHGPRHGGWGQVFSTLLATARGLQAAQRRRVERMDAEIGQAWETAFDPAKLRRAAA